MANSTADYKTGFKSTVTINGTTYPKARTFSLPKLEAATVKVPHLDGLSTVADGDTSYGQLVVEIPEDGSANFTRNTEITCSALLFALTKTMTGKGYIVGDQRAQPGRGNALVRIVTVDASEEWTFA